MPESPYPNPPTGPDVQARLQDVARLLRQPGNLDPEARRALTDLVDELSKTLETSAIPAASVTRLAESTAHLAEALHHPRQNELPVTVRDRLARAALNAEAHAPTAAGLAHRLLEALANIGI